MAIVPSATIYNSLSVWCPDGGHWTTTRGHWQGERAGGRVGQFILGTAAAGGWSYRGREGVPRGEYCYQQSVVIWTLASQPTETANDKAITAPTAAADCFGSWFNNNLFVQAAPEANAQNGRWWWWMDGERGAFVALTFKTLSKKNVHVISTNGWGGWLRTFQPASWLVHGNIIIIALNEWRWMMIMMMAWLVLLSYLDFCIKISTDE